MSKCCGITGHIKKLGRQATQLIKRKQIIGDSFRQVRIASIPDQSEADLVPVCQKPLSGRNPSGEFPDRFVCAKHDNRLSLIHPVWTELGIQLRPYLLRQRTDKEIDLGQPLLRQLYPVCRADDHTTDDALQCSVRSVPADNMKDGSQRNSETMLVAVGLRSAIVEHLAKLQLDPAREAFWSQIAEPMKFCGSGNEGGDAVIQFHPARTLTSCKLH